MPDGLKHQHKHMRSVTMNTYEPAEAAVEDAEPSLVVGDLDEALYIPIVVGTNHPVGVGVDLVDAARCHF